MGRILASWFGCFLTAIVVVLLQMWPYTGIFLMFLAAPFWSVLLINLGFAWMARDAWTGKLPTSFLILPVLYFGGYLSAAALSHWDANRFNAFIAAQNANKIIGSDPIKHDLVLEDRNQVASEVLVREYRVSRAFDGAGESRKPKRLMLVNIKCPAKLHVSGYPNFEWWQMVSVGGYDDLPSLTAERLCLHTSNADPARPIVRVQADYPVRSGGFIETERSRITITGPNGRSIELAAGSAAPLSWLPLPVIGCGLNSGAAKWECMAQFLHKGTYSTGPVYTPHDVYTVIAAALKLHKADYQVRYPNAGWSRRQF